MLTAYFYHKTTGLPLTDPAVTVYVTLANMNQDVKILDNAPMTASTSFIGAFRHGYTIDTETDYMVYYSCSSTDYIPQVDKLFIPRTGVVGAGGASINYWAISSHTTKKINELDEKLTKELDILKENDKEIYKKINENDSHILANGEKIDNIEPIDLSSVTGWIGTLKAQFTKLSEWIKNKDTKVKSEELIEKEGEYSELVESIEEEYKTLLSSKDQEIERLQKELEESKKKEDGYEAMVDVLEEEIQETKDKVEKETKENLIKTISTL